MYRCESWTIKKAECQRIDAFELWWWRRLLRVLWTARRSNQSILREINPEYSLEGLILKLKIQYFGHLMRRADSLEKILMLGKGKESSDTSYWESGPNLSKHREGNIERTLSRRFFLHFLPKHGPLRLYPSLPISTSPKDLLIIGVLLQIGGLGGHGFNP